MSKQPRLSTVSMSDFSVLVIDTSILKDIVNCVGICASCQGKNIILNIDQTKKKGLSLPVTLLCTT